MRIIRKATAGELGDGPSALLVGLDLSLTGTGVAIWKNGAIRRVCGWTSVKATHAANPTSLNLCTFSGGATDSNKVYRQMRLLTWLREEVIGRAGRGSVIAVEGWYGHSSRGGAISALHGLGEGVKVMAMERGIPLRIYTPQQIKIAVAGKGNADKADVKLGLYKLWKLDNGMSAVPLDFSGYGTAGENLADAASIVYLLSCELAVRRRSAALAGMPPGVRKVLSTKAAKGDSLLDTPFIRGEDAAVGITLTADLNC